MFIAPTFLSHYKFWFKKKLKNGIVMVYWEEHQSEKYYRKKKN